MTAGPLRRTLALAAPADRRRVIGAIAAGAAASACAIGLLATSGFLISRAALHPPVLELMAAIVGVRAFALGRAGLRYVERLRTHDAALRFQRDVRAAVFERLEPLAPEGLHLRHSGDLLARAVVDVQTLDDVVVRGVVPFLVAAVIGIAAVATTWMILPTAGLALAGGLGIAGIGVPLFALVAGRRAGQEEAGARGRLSSLVVDAIQCSRELSALQALEGHLEDVSSADRRLSRLVRRAGAINAATAGVGTAAAGITAIAVLVAAVAARQSGALSGVLIAPITFLTIATFESIAPLSSAAQRIEAVRGAASRVFELADTPLPVADPAAPESLPAGRPELVLRNAGVRIGDVGPWALRDVDLSLRPGARLAVVGTSGGGKTTLAHVLVRFRELDAGEYRISGTDVRLLSQDDVRGEIAIAGQEAYLFDTTIRENVRLARPVATDGEVIQALRLAQAWDWVASLPDGLDTRVGEHGRSLSGGQRQRIALARVLVSEAPVVVLDEPAANLDAEAADALLGDVLAATQGRTLVLISHRLIGLDAFDEIVVLDAGHIVERGRHDELLAAGGTYRQLWELQQGDDAETSAYVAAASASR